MNLAMDVHIKCICQMAYFQLRTIRTVISPDPLERLVHAFVTASLNYYNILYGFPEASVKKLQLVQNSAARLVLKTHKYEHITPILKALHWLPVRQRIDFKVLILTYKALNGLVTSYISNMFQEYQPARRLRTTDSKTESKHCWSYILPLCCASPLESPVKCTSMMFLI